MEHSAYRPVPLSQGPSGTHARAIDPDRSPKVQRNKPRSTRQRHRATAARLLTTIIAPPARLQREPTAHGGGCSPPWLGRCCPRNPGTSGTPRATAWSRQRGEAACGNTTRPRHGGDATDDQPAFSASNPSRHRTKPNWVFTPPTERRRFAARRHRAARLNLCVAEPTPVPRKNSVDERRVQVLTTGRATVISWLGSAPQQAAQRRRPATRIPGTKDRRSTSCTQEH